MKSLRNIAERELDLGIRKLWKEGIGIEQWNAMLGADDTAMARLAAAWPGFVPGVVYSAEAMSEILGIPIKANGPVPKPVPGSIIVYYDGWSLSQLCSCPAGVERMYRDQSDPRWHAKTG